jgi:hypothetical protein
MITTDSRLPRDGRRHAVTAGFVEGSCPRSVDSKQTLWARLKCVSAEIHEAVGPVVPYSSYFSVFIGPYIQVHSGL